jgi:cyclophilin family peptidyl-prolyl cis-trans isomerase
MRAMNLSRSPFSLLPLLLPLLLAAALACSTPVALAAGTRVQVTTSVGEFTLELEDERAPLTVANFLRYVREGHYNQTLFHRVVAEFMIQGGGYGVDYTLRKTHESVPNEAGNGLLNVRGTVGLARTGNPHSGDAQFFVNLVDNMDLNPLPSRWGYAVFGRVVDGMDVVDQIGLTPTGAQGPLKANAPLKPVVIERVTVVGETAPAAAPGTPAIAPTIAPAAAH